MSTNKSQTPILEFRGNQNGAFKKVSASTPSASSGSDSATEKEKLRVRLAEIDAEEKAALELLEAENEKEKGIAKARILELSEDAKDFRKQLYVSLKEKKSEDVDFLRDSLNDINDEIFALRAKWNITEKVVDNEESSEERIKILGISTTKAVAITTGVVVAIGVLFWRLCISEMATNPNNDGVLRMLNTTGLRIMLNFLFVGLSVLTSIVFIYLFLHDLWVWLHNRIDSDFSLKNDLELCTPSQRLHFFTLNFWLPAFLFALCLLVIMG